MTVGMCPSIETIHSFLVQSMRIHGVDRERDRMYRIGFECERINKMMFVFNSLFHSNGL